MEAGHIQVTTKNIFPIIKKFLYSDHEIFLRELVANAVDATQKLKKLASLGEMKSEIGDSFIEILADKDAGTLTIRDRGIGMTDEEVKKYINQIAFSSAQEFLDQYQNLEDGATIIGKFGLGFYSAFMVASQVEVVTQSWKPDTKAVRWTCDGNPEYTLDEAEKEFRGTDVILHIAEDSKEFLEDERIETLLQKYCRFLPVEIKFKDKVVNNPRPAWTKAPSDLKDEDYQNFYKELYPFSEPPLFWIHLNVDYPFNLTGILFFPRFKNTIEPNRNKIQLYCRQVFVTDSVEEIVPEYLMLLHGVIDSPDIPLNVSRSYLQSDPNVKKINSYISRKVAEKLEEMFKNDRPAFEEKWPNMSIFVKYGMLSDEKFYERASKFALLSNVENRHFTVNEYQEHIKPAQTDKDNKVVAIYTNNPEEQHAYTEEVKSFGYDILVLNEPLDSHFIQHLESKTEGFSFVRVDSDTPSELIKKEEERQSVLTEEEVKSLEEVFKGAVTEPGILVQTKALGPDDKPVLLLRPEFSRRMKEMSELSGGGGFGAAFPEFLNLVVNTNHPIHAKLLQEQDEEKKKQLAGQLTDLALLAQGMLKGEKLSRFVKRSFDLI